MESEQTNTKDSNQQETQDAVIKSGAPQGDQADNQATLLDARLKELEGFLSERDKEIIELKEILSLAGQDMEAAKLSATESRATLEQAQAALSERDKAMSNILTAYRTAIMQAHPEIPEEMVTGNTLEELQASLSKAEGIVTKIRSQVMTIPGPAGAPTRKGPDVTAMSSREKIVQGLKGNGR